MILIIGSERDRATQFLAEALDAGAQPFVWLRAEEAGACGLELVFAGGAMQGWLQVRGASYATNDFKGVYVASDTFGRMMGRLPGERAAQRERVLADLLARWLAMVPCRVVNRPKANAGAIDEAWLHGLARREGFAQPARLITADVDKAKAWLRRHGRATARPLLGEASEQVVATENAGEHSGRAGESILYEEIPTGVDVRVLVVARTVWANFGADRTLEETSAEDTCLGQGLAKISGKWARSWGRIVRGLGLECGTLRLRQGEDGRLWLLGVTEEWDERDGVSARDTAGLLADYFIGKNWIQNKEAVDSRPPALHD